MKKIVLLFAFVLCSIYGFSQNAMYGVRAGFNISNLDFKPAPTGFANEHRNGFAIGFFGEYKLSNSLALAPEIQFSSEGANDQGLKIDYIQMPIYFKYKIGDKFAIGLGPQVSLKGHDYEDGLKNIAFSGIGGIEYMLSDEFFIDARYSYGLTNIFDDETKLEAINTNIQIGFGLKF